MPIILSNNNIVVIPASSVASNIYPLRGFLNGENMVFGKKKNKEEHVYDLGSHTDKHNYEIQEEEAQSKRGDMADVADHLLIAELEFRGYTVSKK